MLHLFRLLLFRSFFNLYSKNNFKYSALLKSKLDVEKLLELNNSIYTNFRYLILIDRRSIILFKNNNNKSTDIG